MGEISKLPGGGSAAPPPIALVGIVDGRNYYRPGLWDELPDCDWQEFRGDGFPRQEVLPRLREFRNACQRFGTVVPRIIFTLRLRRDGGEWPDAEAAERLDLWREAAREPRVDLLDVEAEEAGGSDGPAAALRPILEARGSGLLISHHNFAGAYDLAEYRRRAGAMRACGARALKFAVTCRDEAELDRLLDFAAELGREGRPHAVFSMGAPGTRSRLLAPALGCPLAYAFVAGEAVAPGQVRAAAMRRAYRSLGQALASGAPVPSDLGALKALAAVALEGA